MNDSSASRRLERKKKPKAIEKTLKPAFFTIGYLDIAWILPYILGISGFRIKRNVEDSIYAQFIDFITEIQSPWKTFRKYHMIQYTITNKMTN